MKLKDGITGFIVGDALGVPVEFNSKEELENNPVTDMEGYGTYNQPKGTWSDDTSMTIATMRSIVDKKGIDYEDIMEKFCDWKYKDKFNNNTPMKTFDCGITVGSALYEYKNGTPAINCGPTDDRSNGNGSLMRVLPLAFLPDIDYETIENISALTHGHKRSKIACVLYVEIAKSMIENEDLTIDEHIKNASEKIKDYYKDLNELEHFKTVFNGEISEGNSGKGYVIYTFEIVTHCLMTTDNYRDAVLKAISFGIDTDTNAAICGGLAGIYYGFDAIPIDWVESINHLDKVLSLCENFEAFSDECQ